MAWAGEVVDERIIGTVISQDQSAAYGFEKREEASQGKVGVRLISP